MRRLYYLPLAFSAVFLILAVSNMTAAKQETAYSLAALKGEVYPGSAFLYCSDQSYDSDGDGSPDNDPIVITGLGKTVYGYAVSANPGTGTQDTCIVEVYEDHYDSDTSTNVEGFNPHEESTAGKGTGWHSTKNGEMKFYGCPCIGVLAYEAR